MVDATATVVLQEHGFVLDNSVQADVSGGEHPKVEVTTYKHPVTNATVTHDAGDDIYACETGQVPFKDTLAFGSCELDAALQELGL